MLSDPLRGGGFGFIGSLGQLMQEKGTHESLRLSAAKSEPTYWS